MLMIQIYNTKEEAFIKANQVIGLVHRFMKCNMLHINLSKCFFMYFRPNIWSRNICNKIEPYNSNNKLVLNGKKIKQVSTTKFLGVTIDENLTWLPHIENLSKKLSMCHGTLKRIKDAVPKKLHKTLYHALFESHLTYGISVWGAQPQSVLGKLFVIQKKCVRMLFGGNKIKTDEYCYCKYGESGMMLACGKCKNWFHGECLGLADEDILTISEFYCPECLLKDQRLNITYHDTSSPIIEHDSFCHCQGPESGLMIECNKCKIWYHNNCIGLNEADTKNILLYFCQNCINTDCRGSLKVIYRDYCLENTKPLFNNHKIMTVHNLYSYHTFLEIYKILKFRTPYCIFQDLFHDNRERHMDLAIEVPMTRLHCQRVTFIYQGILLWNRYYKQLLIPFTIPLHHEYRLLHNLTEFTSIHYDYSTKVSAVKSKLSNIILQAQKQGDCNLWVLEINTLPI